MSKWSDEDIDRAEKLAALYDRADPDNRVGIMLNALAGAEMHARRTISDIHGFTDVEKSMEMRAIDAESQADEFAAELDRMRADIKVYEARLRDRDNRVQELSLQVMDVERERDEARESLAGGRYNGMWMVLGCIGAWAHFEREQNRARDFFWKYDIMRSMIEAVEGLESDLAQRDRRIAELEAALRKMIRLGAQDGVELIRLADAALSASAQPATAAKCASCMGTGKKMGFAESTEPCWHCAAPPSTAAPVNDGYFTCPVCKGIGSHGDECQWLQEHYPAAPTLGDELHKHERYLNREINYDERHAPAAREATKANAMGCVDHWHCDPTVAAHLCRSSHSGQCPSCGERAGAETVISSNRDEDAAWTAHKALVQARATIKLAVECEDGIDGAQAEVTFRMIAAALAALDAARSKETK